MLPLSRPVSREWREDDSSTPLLSSFGFPCKIFWVGRTGECQGRRGAQRAAELRRGLRKPFSTRMWGGGEEEIHRRRSLPFSFFLHFLLHAGVEWGGLLLLVSSSSFLSSPSPLSTSLSANKTKYDDFFFKMASRCFRVEGRSYPHIGPTSGLREGGPT